MQLLAASLFFGAGFVSVDGLRTTRNSAERSSTRPGMKIYDDPENLPPRDLPEFILTPGDFPQCHLSKSDCNINDMKEATLVYTDSDTSRCWNGEPFAFLVHPGARDKLLYYFPGGGACWELPIRLPGAMSICFSNMVTGLSSTGYGMGVMDFGKSENIFRDYTIVSPPYCSGGAHVANTTVDGLLKTHYQYDYNNNEFARSWYMKNLNSQLDSFVIMGSSAGSLGASLWADFLLSNTKYNKASVLLDSYVGVFPKGSKNTQGELLRGFETCNLPFAAAFKKQCESGDALVEDILDAVIAKHPRVAFAHMQAKTDTVQRAFYSAVALSFLDVPNLVISKTSFYKTTNTLMQRYNKHPNYVTYLVEGGWHVFTPWGFWWSTSTKGQSSAPPAGTPSLAEWARRLVAHEAVESECHGKREKNGGAWYRQGTDYCDEQLFPKTLRV